MQLINGFLACKESGTGLSFEALPLESIPDRTSLYQRPAPSMREQTQKVDTRLLQLTCTKMAAKKQANQAPTMAPFVRGIQCRVRMISVHDWCRYIFMGGMEAVPAGGPQERSASYCGSIATYNSQLHTGRGGAAHPAC